MFVEFSLGRLWLMASIWTKVGSSTQPCLVDEAAAQIGHDAAPEARGPDEQEGAEDLPSVT